MFSLDLKAQELFRSISEVPSELSAKMSRIRQKHAELREEDQGIGLYTARRSACLNLRNISRPSQSTKASNRPCQPLSQPPLFQQVFTTYPLLYLLRNPISCALRSRFVKTVAALLQDYCILLLVQDDSKTVSSLGLHQHQQLSRPNRPSPLQRPHALSQQLECLGTTRAQRPRTLPTHDPQHRKSLWKRLDNHPSDAKQHHPLLQRA